MDRTSLLSQYPIDSAASFPQQLQTAPLQQPQPVRYQPVVAAVVQQHTLFPNESIVHRAVARRFWLRPADEFAFEYHIAQLPPFISAAEWAQTIERINGALQWPNGANYAYNFCHHTAAALLILTIAVVILGSVLLNLVVVAIPLYIVSLIVKRQQRRAAINRANMMLASDNTYFATPRAGKLPARVSVQWFNKRCASYETLLIVSTTAEMPSAHIFDVAALHQQQQYHQYVQQQQQAQYNV